MPVPFKAIKQEPESIYDRKVILEMSEADYLALRHYANYYAGAVVDVTNAAAARFANGTPEGYYTLDYSKLFTTKE